MPAEAPADEAGMLRIGADGTITPVKRAIADEAPIAIELNGLGYAVLMATPADLEDLGLGFALAERLIDEPADVREVTAHAAPSGWVLRLTLAPHLAERVLERVRHRVSESSCGLCGVENLEQVMRPLPRVTGSTRAESAAVFNALAALPARQSLNHATGAVHAAALCAPDGAVRLVREDVGRHNALDKLIGAMRRWGLNWDGGFALVTSRLSFEMVEKAVLAGCPLLAAISAPTGLALARAREAGLQLRVLVRTDSMLVP